LQPVCNNKAAPSDLKSSGVVASGSDWAIVARGDGLLNFRVAKQKRERFTSPRSRVWAACRQRL